MRAPKHRRTNPKHLSVGKPPEGVSLEEVADKIRYVGSAYHKDIPSFAGPVPRARPDASICPRDLAVRQAELQEWLRAAVLRGDFSAFWENGFPRYVWRREGPITYEARLINARSGEYKGYPLEADERVRGLE